MRKGKDMPFMTLAEMKAALWEQACVGEQTSAAIG